jgi:hypothetical protein
MDPNSGQNEDRSNEFESKGGCSNASEFESKVNRLNSFKFEGKRESNKLI